MSATTAYICAGVNGTGRFVENVGMVMRQRAMRRANRITMIAPIVETTI